MVPRKKYTGKTSQTPLLLRHQAAATGPNCCVGFGFWTNSQGGSPAEALLRDFCAAEAALGGRRRRPCGHSSDPDENPSRPAPQPGPPPRRGADTEGAGSSRTPAGEGAARQAAGPEHPQPPAAKLEIGARGTPRPPAAERRAGRAERGGPGPGPAPAGDSKAGL